MEVLGPSEWADWENTVNRYKEELKEMLEIWFGEDIVDKIVIWISKNINKSLSIIDIGCGNGHLLIELGKEGYTNLTGLDYSPKAVNLARAIAEKQDLNIKYNVNNVLGLADTYDVLHDKGIYDAISLSKNSKEDRQKYIVGIQNALNENGYFIVTSSNWTQMELVEQYKQHFILHTVIPSPQFKFGGKVSVVTICVFRKKD